MRNKRNYIVSAKNQTGQGIDKFITIVLLGENHGYRMKSYGATSLLKVVNDRSLLELQIEAIKSVFCNYEIILCSGFEVKKINDFVKSNLKNENIRIVENQVHYNSNCCESIRLSLNNTMNQKILISSGDVVLTSNYLSQFNYDKTSLMVQQYNANNEFEISVVSGSKNVTNMCLGEKNNFWTESIFLNGEETIQKIYNLVSNVEYKNKFMFEAINHMSKNTRIKVLENKNIPVIKINNIKTLKNIRKNNENTGS